MSNGKWARTDTEKVDLFCNHLESVFRPHPNENPPTDEKEVLEFLSDENTRNEEVTIKFTKDEVIRAIKNVNLKKAPGYELITARRLPDLENYHNLV